MPVTATFTTQGLPGAKRALHWTRAITESYFPLDLDFAAPDRFGGELSLWRLGGVEASRLRSDAALYRRSPSHLRSAGEEEFLLTIPRSAPVRFLQMGREVVCPPGGFILERGNEPYEFSYDTASDLVVAKIGYRQLARRLGNPGRFCAIQFDASRGIGAVMVDLLMSSGQHSGDLDEPASGEIGAHLVDLLALAIEQDPRAAEIGETSVRAAHLRRIARCIATLLPDKDLSPATVASACGISLRYLHDLCSGDGRSFGERLREARLLAARGALSRKSDRRSILEIAFACGFADASSFSRAYRTRFGESPSETRRRS